MNLKKTARFFLILSFFSFLVGCTPEEPKSTEEEFEEFIEATKKRKEREAEREKNKQFIDAIEAFSELE